MDLAIMMWIWLAVIAIAALLEAFTLQMVSIWFVPGGLVGLILHFCGVGYEWQIVAVIVVSLILLFGLRKFCLKIMFKNKADEKTNSDSLVGQIFVLKKSITPTANGELRVADVTWTAITADKTQIDKDARVEVVEIRGNKLVVKAIDSPKSVTPVADTSTTEGNTTDTSEKTEQD